MLRVAKRLTTDLRGEANAKQAAKGHCCCLVPSVQRGRGTSGCLETSLQSTGPGEVPQKLSRNVESFKRSEAESCLAP